jgi:hypothetical protein
VVGKEKMATKTLYVGNLPYSISEQDLLTYFAAYSPQKVRIVEGRGFGFVDIAEDQVETAINEKHNSEMGGRKLTVNEARPREPRSGGGGGGGYGGGGGGGYGGGGGGGYGGGGGGGKRGDYSGGFGGGGGGRGGGGGGGGRGGSGGGGGGGGDDDKDGGFGRGGGGRGGGNRGGKKRMF